MKTSRVVVLTGGVVAGVLAAMASCGPTPTPCRTDEPGFNNADCYDDGSWDINTRDVYAGNRNLDVETRK